MDEARPAGVSPLASLRRGAPIVAGFTIVAALVLSIAIAALPPNWSTSATLSISEPVDPTVSTDLRADPARYLATQSTLAIEDRVITAAAKKLSVSPDTVRGDVSISLPGEGDILLLTATGTTGEEARATAQTVAETYRDLQLADQQAKLKAQLANFDQQLQTLTATARNSTAGSLEADVAKAQYQNVFSLRSQVAAQEANPSGPVSIVAGASVPGSPTTPGALTGGLLGATIGFIVGSVFVVGRAQRRLRPVIASDIAIEFGLPLLADLDDTTAKLSGRSLIDEPAGSLSPPEQIRALEIALRQGPLATKVVLITSAGRRQGKSTVARHLALAAAQSHRNVLLIDADVRTANLVGAHQSEGLTDALNRWGTDQALPNVVQGAEPSLHLLGPGTALAIGPDLLRSTYLEPLIHRLAEGYNLVVIDGPALSVAETPALANAAGALILSVNPRGSKIVELDRAQTRLSSLSTRILGIVILDPRRRRRAKTEYPGLPSEQADAVSRLTAGRPFNSPPDGLSSESAESLSSPKSERVSRPIQSS